MASPVGHSLVGVAAYLLAARRPLAGGAWTALGVIACVGLANLPDFDMFAPLLFGRQFGLAFHRGLSHSLAFAAFAGAMAALLAAAAPRMAPALGERLPEWRRAGLWAGLLVASHLMLDVFGYDARPPYGVPLFAPFSSTYFVSPVPLFAGVRNTSLAVFLTPTNFAAMASDLWLAVPLLVLARWRWRRGAR